MVLQPLRKDACQPQSVQGGCWVPSLIPAKMKSLMYQCQVSRCKGHSLGMCEQHLAQQCKVLTLKDLVCPRCWLFAALE